MASLKEVDVDTDLGFDIVTKDHYELMRAMMRLQRKGLTEEMLKVIKEGIQDRINLLDKFKYDTVPLQSALDNLEVR